MREAYNLTDRGPHIEFEYKYSELTADLGKLLPIELRTLFDSFVETYFSNYVYIHDLYGENNSVVFYIYSEIKETEEYAKYQCDLFIEGFEQELDKLINENN